MSIEDRAQIVELRDWERNNRIRPGKLSYAPGEPEYGPAECDDCGDDMPEVRRAYGYRVCVSCKSSIEEATRRRL